MEVIIPCAGLSSRFPNMRPKYLLTDYKGRLMVENAVRNYIGKHSVTIVVLKEHNLRFGAVEKLRDAFQDQVRIVVLDNPTSGPADTVRQAILQSSIDRNATLLIKDCDSFFDARESSGNGIYVASLTKNPNTKNAVAKSYVMANDQGIVMWIIEKKIISDHFCCGGYQFKDANLFLEAYDEVAKTCTSEMFVSGIIEYLLKQRAVFVEHEVENYVDVGTADDWFLFNDRPTYFCDIDGTLVKSKFNYYEPYEPIIENVEKMLSELKRGCKIVFCTSRPSRFREITQTMLNDLGFAECPLIMDIHHSKRVVVNDYAKSNPYPSAIAINLKRDDNNLGDLL